MWMAFVITQMRFWVERLVLEPRAERPQKRSPRPSQPTEVVQRVSASFHGVRNEFDLLISLQQLAAVTAQLTP
jgi:hypothetical protein